MDTHTTLKLAPTVQLCNRVEMPKLGLGTSPLNDEEAASAVESALELGYRLIDTAENYGNERGVGEGLRNSGVPREEVFITTKINRESHGVEGAWQACERSMQRMGLDYIDLLLVHWPNPDQNLFVEAFRGLVDMLEQGKVRAVGTSNFKASHLQQLYEAGFTPNVNQIQLDPYHRQEEVLAVHPEYAIVTQAWRPLGRGTGLLQDPLITSIAARLGRTPSQIVLRWHMQHDYAVVVKSANPQHQAENLDVFDFSLSPADMIELDSLGRHDPDMLDSDVFGH